MNPNIALGLWFALMVSLVGYAWLGRMANKATYANKNETNTELPNEASIIKKMLTDALLENARLKDRIRSLEGHQ